MQGHFQPWTKRAGSFGSAVGRLRSINLTLTLTLTLMRNNLYCVKCGVHVFSGSFGSSGSAVDQRTKYKLFL